MHSEMASVFIFRGMHSEMASVFIKLPYRKSVCVSCKPNESTRTIFQYVTEELIHQHEDYYIECNNRHVAGTESIQNGATYYVVPRLLGGKGGFGSMLRAIGAQIEKTTNREACRDLSGRRMRDVNNEKKLRNWVSRKADREREREERRRQKMKRRRSVPKHNFNDPTYEEQKRKVAEGLDDALQQGLQTAASSSADSRKRKSKEPGPSTSKRTCEWLGVDVDPSDLSDVDTSDSSSSSSDEPTPEPGSDSPSQSDGEVQPQTSSSTAMSSSEQGDKPADGKTDGTVATENNGDPSISTNDATVQENTVNGNAMAESTESSITPTTDSKPCEDPAELDLSQYDSAKSLEALGLDILKAALMSRGLKCGGSVSERAARLYSIKGLTPDQINPSLFSKGGKAKGKRTQ